MMKEIIYEGVLKVNGGEQPLTFFINYIDQTLVQGRIITSGRLSIGTDFSASRNDAHFDFVTITNKGKLTVTWVAAFSDEKNIAGKFTALNEGLRARFFRKKLQEGEWQCSKKRFSFAEAFFGCAAGVLSLGFGCILIVGFCFVRGQLTDNNSYLRNELSTSEYNEAKNYNPQSESKPVAEKSILDSYFFKAADNIISDPQVQEGVVKLFVAPDASSVPSFPPRDVHVSPYVDKNNRYVPEHTRSRPNSNQ